MTTELKYGPQTKEIEVTPEMIQAGLDAYREIRGSEASDFHEREIIENVYRRMASIAVESSFSRSIPESENIIRGDNYE